MDKSTKRLNLWWDVRLVKLNSFVFLWRQIYYKGKLTSICSFLVSLLCLNIRESKRTQRGGGKKEYMNYYILDNVILSINSGAIAQ